MGDWLIRHGEDASVWLFAISSLLWVLTHLIEVKITQLKGSKQ